MLLYGARARLSTATAPALYRDAVQAFRASLEGGPDSCHMLGEAQLCTETTCKETTIFLCTEPSEDPGVTCVLQEGLHMNGKPVYACGPTERFAVSPQADHGTALHRPPRRGDVRMSSGPTAVDVSDLGVTMEDLETPLPSEGGVTSSGRRP